MYSEDLRNALILAYKNGERDYDVLSIKFKLSKQTARRWVRLMIPIEITQASNTGRHRRFSSDQLEILQCIVNENSTLGLRPLAKAYAERTKEKAPSPTTILFALRELGYTSHYKTKIQRKQNQSKENIIESEKPKEHRYNKVQRTLPESLPHRKAYPSDLSEGQWNILAPLLEKKDTRGRKREFELREIVNAIFYILRTGCQWRYLPHDFPKWTLVAKTFYRWKSSGLWNKVNTKLRELNRESVGREITPSASIIDSQSVKTTEKGGEKGFDAGKK